MRSRDRHLPRRRAAGLREERDAPARRRSRAAVAGVAPVAAVGVSASCSGTPVVRAPGATVGSAPAIGTVPHGVLVTPTGVIAPILARDGSGYWVRTPCYAMARVETGHVIDHVDVLLDPGHGGPEV